MTEELELPFEDLDLPAEPKPKKEEGPDDLIIGHNPDKVDSKYLLLVNRAQPFGYGFTVFCIDALEPLYVQRGKNEQAVLAYKGLDEEGNLVTQFPASFQYLLINRSAYKPFYTEPEKVERVKTGNYL